MQPRQVSPEPASPVLQIGVGFMHSELLRHCTHVCVVVSHTPFEQSVFMTHPTQPPVWVSQALFVPEAQSVLAVQPRHEWLVASQMGVLPLQFASVPHCTHCWRRPGRSAPERGRGDSPPP